MSIKKQRPLKRQRENLSLITKSNFERESKQLEIQCNLYPEAKTNG